jgi:hypothetical protein
MKATCAGSKSLVYLAGLDKLFELVLEEEGLTEHLKEAHTRFAGVADEVRQKAKAALEEDHFM